MTASPPPGEHAPGSRLERALELFLAETESGAPDPTSLLDRHVDLRDLLEPMVHRSDTGSAPSDEAVLGDYRIVREIGRGGMGIVYEAWQRSLDRRVAIKVLAPALTSSPSAVARFRREAAAAGRLRHPGIVEVLDFGSSGDRHFFAMQLVEGEPLHQCGERSRAPQAAVALIVQVAEALEHAHAAGLVHRDVKPANILIRSDATVVLTDFGLASDEALPSMTREGGFLGTVDYAAPEQLRGERADARADLFAIGVVLYELLSGRHPFRAATQAATMHRILSLDPPSLHAVDRRIPVDVAAVVGRALEKNVARRYASAAALAADLRAVQRGDPVTARLASTGERLVRWTRREPWRAAAVVLLGLGVPSATGAVGFVLAKAPVLAAGEVSLTMRARQELLALVWLDYTEGDMGRGLRRLDELRPRADDEESAIARTLMLLQLQRRDEAARALAPWTTPAANVLARAQRLPHPAGDAAPEAPPEAATAMQCFLNGIMAYAKGMRADDEPGPFKVAMAEFHRGLLLSPTPRPTMLLMLVRAAMHANDKAMLALARSALELHFAGFMFTRAVLADAVALEDPVAGLAICEKLSAESPSTSAWHYNIGVLQAKLGHAGEAERAYRRCIELEPSQARAWNNLGMLLRQRGALDEAVAAYQTAVAARPDFAKAWNNLGNAWTKLGDFDGARSALTRALAESPGYAKASYNLGNLHLATGDNAAAIASYQEALATEPDYAKALSNLTVAYMRSERWEEALVPAERVLSLAPADLDRLGNLAVVAVMNHRGALARQVTTRWTELAPRASQAWALLGQAWLLEPGPDLTAALAAATRAVELAPADVEANLALANTEVAGGQPEQARVRLARLAERGGLEKCEPRLRQDFKRLRELLRR